jgi:hypothetical protein
LQEKKMIHDIPAPPVSPGFTIDDIHAIREWQYERLKDASIPEWIAEIRRQAEPGIRAIEKLREKMGKGEQGTPGEFSACARPAARSAIST